LFAVYPILFLWAHNVEELSSSTSPIDIFFPLAISIGFTAVALASCTLILKDTKRAGLLVLLFLLAFYSYGHIYTPLQNAGIVDASRQWLFFLAWACLSGFAGGLALMIRAELRGFTNWLNIVAGLVVVISLVNIGTYTLGVSQIESLDYGNQESSAFQIDVSNPNTLPNIYYIVPDSYASSRVLGDFGYDNADFTDYLTEKGFFVAHESRSNYMHTLHSLASSLNMQYLTHIAGALSEDTPTSFDYRGMILNGRVIDNLRALGYTIIDTRDQWMVQGDRLDRQSLQYSSRRVHLNCANRRLIGLQADDFPGAVLSTTALYPVLRFYNVVEGQIWNQQLCQFAMITKVMEIEGPKFVYSHLRVPHPPFIFDRHGAIDPESLATANCSSRCEERYVDQVAFVNKKLKEIVDGLLSGNGTSPIIIIQSDHGTRVVDGGDFTRFHPTKFGILNAYLLPGGGNELLYETISPVNTFRIIFNHYFGADYQMLEDRNYYTDPPFSKSTHVDVTERVQE
jgi:hypothetical protein